MQVRKLKFPLGNSGNRVILFHNLREGLNCEKSVISYRIIDDFRNIPYFFKNRIKREVFYA